jgi:hypothetical protein
MQAVLGSLSSSVIGRPDVFNLMKQEPANSLLEATYLLQLGQKVIADGPLDAEGLEVEMEMNNLLLSLRPIKQEQLIIDNHKLVLLAALSDSLDYLSESAQQYVYILSFICNCTLTLVANNCRFSEQIAYMKDVAMHRQRFCPLL